MNMPGLLDTILTESGTSTMKTQIPVNISEQNDLLEIELSLPGYRREILDVHLDEDQILRIEGKPSAENQESKILRRRREFSTRPFRKIFRLGKDLDVKGIRAHLQDGILKISIPRIKGEKAVRALSIEVE